MTEIAEKLRTAMRDKEMSYGELADLSNIPKSAVFRYVTGETEKIPLDRIERMAAALGVSAAYLMGWEPEEAMQKMSPSPQQQREALFLELLRKLSPQQQELILAQLQGIVHIPTGQGFL